MDMKHLQSNILHLRFKISSLKLQHSHLFRLNVKFKHQLSRIISVAGADTGFLVGGGANPPGGDTNIQIFQIFPKKCMRFWSGGAHRGSPPWIRHCVAN